MFSLYSCNLHQTLCCAIFHWMNLNVCGFGCQKSCHNYSKHPTKKAIVCDSEYDTQNVIIIIMKQTPQKMYTREAANRKKKRNTYTHSNKNQHINRSQAHGSLGNWFVLYNFFCWCCRCRCRRRSWCRCCSVVAVVWYRIENLFVGHENLECTLLRLCVGFFFLKQLNRPFSLLCSITILFSLRSFKFLL